MSKLTKTEKRVLEKASQNWNGFFTTVQSEGVVSSELTAVRSLREKGLVKQVTYYTEWATHRGRTVLYDITNDMITNEGREALSAAK
jgi:hypothetical protein